MRLPSGPLAVIDLEHLDRPESIAAYLLETGAGPAIVDPGPASALPRLRAGLAARGYRPEDLAALFLTHIHLDHAGASGTLARENPRLKVHVHEKGAPHLVDPAKLIGSAERLYGDRMDSLWGEIAPVPEGQVIVVRGGERIELGGRNLVVGYTPGHAWHHVSYCDEESGVAFVGDTAGIFLPSLPVVLPVTPPPDFDLEAWLASIDRILVWRPEQLALTHFGLQPDPNEHLAALRRGLVEWAGFARDAMRLPGSEERRLSAFVEKLRRWAEAIVPPEQAERYLAGAGPEACWRGLVRYWDRKG